MTTRRGFLGGLLAVTAAPRLGWSAVGSPSFIAAARDADGSYALHGLTSAGIVTFSVPIPARGHAACGHPTRAEAVGFGRRPGHFAVVVDCASGGPLATLTPPDGRHFNGHGAYSNAGDLLFISEQEADGSDGHVGVYDTERYTRIGSFPTTGKGPHEIRMMPDGKSLIIANGGLDTVERDILNTETMEPSLVYADLSGDILDKVVLAPELRMNSIRHLSARPDGLVAFAMQWQGDPSDPVPLLGLHRMGEAPVLAEAPLADQLLMKGYVGSVAFSGDGAEVAITSPRGGWMQRFAPDGAFLGALKRDEICGLSALGDGFVVTDGLGGVLSLDAAGPHALSHSNVSWDHHLIPL